MQKLQKTTKYVIELNGSISMPSGRPCQIETKRPTTTTNTTTVITTIINYYYYYYFYYFYYSKIT